MTTPIETEAIDQMIKELDLNKGNELFGANGLAKQITKRLVLRALEAEVEEHLGYPKGERGDEPRPTPRTGTSSKRVRTDDGEIELQVPRDRDGTSQSQRVVPFLDFAPALRLSLLKTPPRRLVELSDVAVVEITHARQGDHLPLLKWLELTLPRRILLQAKMGSVVMVVGDVSADHGV